MNVGESVAHSLRHWGAGETEWNAAMMHACNAIDGTAGKRYPNRVVGDRFRQVVRDDLPILSAMALANLNLKDTRWPVPVESFLPDKRPDIADIVYVVHRCSHNHGDELPKGFELTPPESTPLSNGDGRSVQTSTIHYEDQKLRLPAATILGLVAIAVAADENRDQQIDQSFYLTCFDRHFVIQDWWGWGDHMREIFGRFQFGSVTLEFGNRWNDWSPPPKKRLPN